MQKMIYICKNQYNKMMKRIMLLGLMLAGVSAAAQGVAAKPSNRVRTMNLQYVGSEMTSDYTFHYDTDGRLASYDRKETLKGEVSASSYTFTYDDMKDRAVLRSSEGEESEYTFLPQSSLLGTHEPFRNLAVLRDWPFYGDEYSSEGCITQFFYNDGMLLYLWAEEFTVNATESLTLNWSSDRNGCLESLSGELYDYGVWGINDIEYEETANPFSGVDPIALLLSTGCDAWWMGMAGLRPSRLIKSFSYAELDWMDAEDPGTEPVWHTVKFVYMKDPTGRILSISKVYDGEVAARIKLTY